MIDHEQTSPQDESQSNLRPLQRIDTGTRWGFSESEYERWWRSLPESDYNTFIAFGGDDLLMRFVCAYDWISQNQDRERPRHIIEAYAMAAKIETKDPQCHSRAAAAWRHPAVQELIDLIRDNDRTRSTARIERQQVAYIEKMLADSVNDDPGKRAMVANAVSKHLANAHSHHEETSKRRLKDVEKLHATIDQHSEQEALPTDDDLAKHMKQLAAHFGEDKIKALMQPDA